MKHKKISKISKPQAQEWEINNIKQEIVKNNEKLEKLIGGGNNRYIDNQIDYYKQNFINKINDISNNSFNKDQKELAIKIINNADNDDLENIYKLITKRLTTGFVFDIAPSCNKQSIAYLKYNNKLSFKNKNENKEYDENNLTNDHILIIGENYDALKNLLLTHRNKIDIIYIDPPYNVDATLNEKNNLSENEVMQKSSTKFVYRDKFSRTGWLNLMQDRLSMAKDLLKEDGVIFVSIDDAEQAYLKVLMDDIFGENNFISDLIWLRNPGGESDNLHIAKTKDFILMYSKNKDKFKINYLKEEINILDYKTESNIIWKQGSMFEKSGKNDRLIDRKNLGYICYYNKNMNDFIIRDDYDKDKIDAELTINKKIYHFDEGLISNGYIPIIPRTIKNTYGRWRIGAKKMMENFNNNLIIFNISKDKQIKMYEKQIFNVDNPYKLLLPKDFITFTTNKSATDELNKIFNNSIFSHPKPSSLIKYLINFHTNENAIILDFFAGSGTTGQAVMELNQEDNGNRKFILVTNNEEIINDNKKPTGKYIGTDICYERLYRIINGIGTKNEKIKWKYDDNIKSLNNNSLLVFDINYANVAINIKNFDSIYKTIIESERKIDNCFDIKEENIIKKLYSLHPLENNKKE